jgi:hypothetical protein
MHFEHTEVTVSLYFQSETIWFVPLLDSSLLRAKRLEDSSHFALASDHTVLPPQRPGRGSGVFKSGQSQVIVPKSHILLEAFLRVYVRDLGKQMGAFAMVMINYVEEYVDGDGFLDATLLPEPLRTSYKELKGGKKPVRQWTTELIAVLGIANGTDNSNIR